jgi:chitin disaccharide deacetylase
MKSVLRTTRKGESYPVGISLEYLISLLTNLSPGVTELGCHPPFEDGRDTIYRFERAQEVKVLCDPQVKATLAAQDIELTSFTGVPSNCF